MFQKRHIPAHPCKTGDPRHTIGPLQKTGARRQVPDAPRTASGAWPRTTESRACFPQGLKGYRHMASHMFQRGNNSMRHKGRGMSQGGRCIHAGLRRSDVGSSVRDRTRAGSCREEGQRHFPKVLDCRRRGHHAYHAWRQMRFASGISRGCESFTRAETMSWDQRGRSHGDHALAQQLQGKKLTMRNSPGHA